MRIARILAYLAVTIILASCSLYEVGSSVPAIPIIIKMNEIYSKGVPNNPDWIELYNGGTTQVDISGYKIYDIGGQSGTKPKMALSPGTTIPVNGYYVVVTDIAGKEGFGLSGSGDEVWLEDSAGAVIDNIVFPAMDETQTYCRIPDGGTTWRLTNSITRGTANKAATEIVR